MKSLPFLISALSVLILIPIVSVSAAIIRVPGDYRTIQAGIDAALSGDTVLVADGEYVENIIFPLGTDIIVKSENGPEATTINGNRAGSVVTFNNGEWADWVLDGFTVENGYAAEGGGVHSIDSSATIINCIISDNIAYEGSGGGIYAGITSSQELLGQTIQPSMAGGGSGGCGHKPTTKVKDSNISNNSSAVNGGGISSTGSSLIVAGCTLSLNTAVVIGGGIYFEGSDSDTTFCLLEEPSEVSHNSASDGGGLAIVRYLISLGSVFVDGVADLNPQIIQDSNDTLHVVWDSKEDLNGAGWDADIFYASNNGTGWSAPSLLNINSTTDTHNDWNPQIIVDSDTLYAVWASKEDINGAGTDYDIFRATNSGSGWSVPELLNANGTTDSGNDFNPQIIKDSSGTLHAVWHSVGDTGPSGTDYDVFYAANYGTGWSAPSLLNINGTADTLYDGFAQIIVDHLGTLHAVWHSNEDYAGAGGDYDIFCATNSGSGWSTPSLLKTNGTTDSGTDAYPQLIEDSSGTLHAVWHSSEDLDNKAGYDDDIFYAYNNGTGWSEPSLLNINGNTDTRDDWDPRIIEDSNGTLHTVWESEEDIDGADTDYDIFCATKNGTGGWSYPSLLNANGTTDSGDDYLPQIIEDSSGDIFHVVWESDEDMDGAGTDFDIFYAYGSCGSWSCPSLLNPSVKLGVININFIGNLASNNGGAIYIKDSNTPISKCIFSGNNANSYGGAIFCSDSSPMVTNCTFADNNAPVGGGVYDHNDSNLTLTNCILWANFTDEINYDRQGSLPVVNYCDVQGGWPGTGNMNLDPLFANSLTGDYHLQSAYGRWDSNRQKWLTDADTSPCIDAADPNSKWTAELWPHGKGTNMGAYGGIPQASMSSSTAGNKADLNNDGFVNVEDLALFAGLWLVEDVLLSEDINRNGLVNFSDFAEYAGQYLWEE